MLGPQLGTIWRGAESPKRWSLARESGSLWNLYPVPGASSICYVGTDHFRPRFLPHCYFVSPQSRNQWPQRDSGLKPQTNHSSFEVAPLRWFGHSHEMVTTTDVVSHQMGCPRLQVSSLLPSGHLVRFCYVLFCFVFGFCWKQEKRKIPLCPLPVF